MNLASLKRAAIDAALRAGAVLEKYQRRGFQVREKKNSSLVTAADVEAEKTAMKILKKAAPSFSFLAEESGKTGSSSEGRWIIDPLDGTTNFVHGFPFYCVSIAAEIHGRLEIGVIYHPATLELFTAMRGQGAKVNRNRLSVSSTRKLSEGLIATGFSYEKADALKDDLKLVERIARRSHGVRRAGSAALDLVYTARGCFDAFWERDLNPWDVAAGILIVEEAGGKVTDYLGNAYQLGCDQLLASNGHIHPELIDALN